MEFTPMGLVDLSFSPSELILLCADHFSPKSDLANGHQLLCSDGVVNGPHLATMMIAAAMLVNEQEGALRIDLSQSKKKMFSSSPAVTVNINPIGQPPAWSSYSLESAVLFTSGQLFAMKKDFSVRNVVYTILLDDREQPWQKIIEIVEWGLASSNWLMPVEGEAAAVFSTPFICPERVRELAFSTPLVEIDQLFTKCRKNSPEVWKLMTNEIKLAFSDRKK